MKRIFKLAFTAAALAGAITMFTAPAPADAQGARFQFEPNTWRKEPPRRPKRHLGPQHNVRANSMPRSAALGLDPTFVKKAQPKFVPATNSMIRSTVASRPKPKVVPQVRGHYKPSFGTPNKPEALVAKQPQKLPSFGQPRQMQAKPAPAMKSTKSVAAKLAPSSKRKIKQRRAHRSTRKIRGKLMPPKKIVPKHAVAKTYHNNMFQAGGYTPTHRNTSSTKTKVHGQIMHY